MDVNTTAWTVLLLPLIVAALIIFGLKRSPGLSALVSTGSVLITFILCMILAGGEGGEAKAFPWIDMGDLFRVEIGFQLDELSRGMMLIVTSIGLLVHIFSLAYMKDDKGKARYFAGLSLFMFSMTGIVLANNFVMMFIFWELVGVSSYILIGHWFHKESAADAAKKAFLTNKIGDFGFMIGILLVWVLTGSIYFEEIKEAVGGVTNLALLTSPCSASSVARSVSPLSFLFMSGYPMRWKAPRLFPLSSMQPRWLPPVSSCSPASSS